MDREIGGEFWLDEVVKEDLKEIPQWLKKFGNITLISSGRGAISLLLTQIKPKIKTVLLPAYICDSVIKPFLNAGYECIYYDLNNNFLSEFEWLNYPDIGVFLHMGYFGFPTNQSLNNVIGILKDKSTIIVEDVTHTLFSNYTRSDANDFYIGSLRKWFGLHSGGFLASRQAIQVNMPEGSERFINLRKEALSIKYKYMKTQNIEQKKVFLEKFFQAEEILDSDTQFYRIDSVSENILKSTDTDALVRQRKINYEYLREHMQNNNKFTILFNNLDIEVCPLFFPILIRQDRDYIRNYFIQNEIYCPIHWSVPEEIDLNIFRNSQQIYASILSIPCDQRYSLTDMKRVIKVLNEMI